MASTSSAGINELFNTKFVNTVYDLPDSSGIPDINRQTSGNIEAWLDIVGFKEMVQEDGVDYVPGPPENYAIVLYEASGSPPGTIDSITHSLNVTRSGNFTIAVLDVIMKWHKVFCDKSGCWTVSYKDSATFQDSEISPKRFDFPGNQSVTLKSYNGSVYKPQVLNFNLSPGITAFNITTNNGSIKQYLRSGQVSYTAKNIPYMNLTKTDHYEQSGRDISKLNKEVVVNSNLSSIEFFTPYGKLNASATITKVQMPETNIKSGVFGLIYMVLIFFGGLYVMFKSVF
jgi:hypothetical protein